MDLTGFQPSGPFQFLILYSSLFIHELFTLFLRTISEATIHAIKVYLDDPRKGNAGREFSAL
jgi:hypothetical protein